MVTCNPLGRAWVGAQRACPQEKRTQLQAAAFQEFSGIGAIVEKFHKRMQAASDLM